MSGRFSFFWGGMIREKHTICPVCNDKGSPDGKPCPFCLKIRKRQYSDEEYLVPPSRQNENVGESSDDAEPVRYLYRNPHTRQILKRSGKKK